MSNSILVIDDDKKVREVCDVYLKKMEFFRMIVYAEDGLVALTKLKNQKFEIILLDINLPKMGAFDLLQTYRDEIPHKTIIISGGLGSVSIKRALHLGVKHFLVKPFTEESLVEKVKLLLGEC